MDRNIDRLAARLRGRVTLRPHLKSSKCIEITRKLLARTQSLAAVSTLHEASYFGEHGVKDLLYAVGISANKLRDVSDLRSRGIDLSVVLDSVPQALAVASKSRADANPIPVLIEVDCDGHRSGVRPDDPELIEIAKILAHGGADLRGVMTHAGTSYSISSHTALEQVARAERLSAAQAAGVIRQAGLPCAVVSIGSTPTALVEADFSEVTEVRAGVFVFFDLVMVGLGVCSLDDIALSVLCTVIGHQPSRGVIIVDAGWMALSSDRGTATQKVDRHFGVVCDVECHPMDDLVVESVNQEHGIIRSRSGSSRAHLALPIGSLLRVLPNHACATASCHSHYNVVRAGPCATAIWHRLSGW